MKLFQYLLAVSFLALAGCEKQIVITDAPDFDISTAQSTYKAGEPIQFNFTGNADIISFYPGTVKNDYKFKEGRTVDLPSQGITLSFQSAVTGGAQQNQLSVLVSNDFSGDYTDLSSVKSASWVDVTSKFTLGTNATFVDSKAVDLSGYAAPGKPLYVAFRYLTKPQLINGAARTWMIQSFEAKSTTTFEGVFPIIKDQIYASFHLIDEDKVNTPSRSAVSSTRLTLLGNTYNNPADPKWDPDNPIYDPTNPIYNPQDPAFNPDAVRPVFTPYDPDNAFNDPLRETWAVSSAIVLDKLNVGPDVAIPLRGLRSTKLTETYYTYAKPGSYEAYFVGKNASTNDTKTTVRKLNLTVTE